MKNYVLMLVSCIFSNIVFGQDFKQEFIAKDIEHFWQAYDKITATKDTLLQKKYINELYLEKGTAGLKSLVSVRNYTQKDFLEAINNSPKFWNSIRKNTLAAGEVYAAIESDLQKLKKHYPAMKPVPVYFAIGAFRTNGTIQENKILIGSEYTLVDERTVVLDDLPKALHSFYKTYRPRKNVALLVTHEYIHTLQKELVDNLLSYCLYEGIAEFISCKVTGKASNSPAIEFGKANQDAVVQQFVKDLYTGDHVYDWLWGENKNHLKERDLGYYIGYEIAARYYAQASDKKKAIAALIELDYAKEQEVEEIVDKAALLPKPLKELYADYESRRPEVVRLIPFENGSQYVSSGTREITIEFSEPMDECCRGFDIGDLGKDHAVQIQKIIRWSEDKKRLTIAISELKADWQYQLNIQNFRNLAGYMSRNYLIEFRTGKQHK